MLSISNAALHEEDSTRPMIEITYMILMWVGFLSNLGIGLLAILMTLAVESNRAEQRLKEQIRNLFAQLRNRTPSATTLGSWLSTPRGSQKRHENQFPQRTRP